MSCVQCDSIAIAPALSMFWFDNPWAKTHMRDPMLFCSRSCRSLFVGPDGNGGLKACNMCTRFIHNGNGDDDCYFVTPTTSGFDSDVCVRCYEFHLLRYGYPAFQFCSSEAEYALLSAQRVSNGLSPLLPHLKDFSDYVRSDNVVPLELENLEDKGFELVPDSLGSSLTSRARFLISLGAHVIPFKGGGDPDYTLYARQGDMPLARPLATVLSIPRCHVKDCFKELDRNSSHVAIDVTLGDSFLQYHTKAPHICSKWGNQCFDLCSAHSYNGNVVVVNAGPIVGEGGYSLQEQPQDWVQLRLDREEASIKKREAEVEIARIDKCITSSSKRLKIVAYHK